MAPGSNLVAGRSSKNDWKIIWIVPIAVREARSKKDHRIVEQRPVAFLDRLQLVEEIGELLGMPAIDLRVRLEFFFLVLMMAEFVMAAGRALNDVREIFRRNVV